ncbi:hypothetical protein TSUD_165080 [Trifolium subterraneum]|uniref:Uncharacterized protein n=1 Tax=Trifolium subterraneum TaxID=3900 RepID=A0A2Z6NP85_TRISU|nr:hypothetical protein TSUD_165080 [Trifolium subterraneum]
MMKYKSKMNTENGEQDTLRKSCEGDFDSKDCATQEDEVGGYVPLTFNDNDNEMTSGSNTMDYEI